MLTILLQTYGVDRGSRVTGHQGGQGQYSRGYGSEKVTACGIRSGELAITDARVKPLSLGALEMRCTEKVYGLNLGGRTLLLVILY